MKIAIIGGGSIGGLIAYFLYRGGVMDLDVYYRSWNSVETVREYNGITIIFSNGKEAFVPIRAYHHTEAYEAYDIVINAVKATDLESTENLMKNIDNGDTLYISLQNGFGSYEYMENLFTPYRVACGVVRIGAQRIRPNVILEKGIGSIVFGQHLGIHKLLPEIARILVKGGCPAWITSNIDFERWLKLGINAVINPLTAIARSPNKIILSEWGKRLAWNILKELVEAANLEGYNLVLDRLYKHVMRVAMVTKENYSSMAQDIIAGRKTEIDYINGYIVRVLESHGRESIINKLIVDLIHLIEESFRE